MSESIEISALAGHPTLPSSTPLPHSSATVAVGEARYDKTFWALDLRQCSS